MKEWQLNVVCYVDDSRESNAYMEFKRIVYSKFRL